MFGLGLESRGYQIREDPGGTAAYRDELNRVGEVRRYDPIIEDFEFPNIVHRRGIVSDFRFIVESQIQKLIKLRGATGIDKDVIGSIACRYGPQCRSVQRVRALYRQTWNRPIALLGRPDILCCDSPRIAQIRLVWGPLSKGDGRAGKLSLWYRSQSLGKVHSLKNPGQL